VDSTDSSADPGAVGKLVSPGIWSKAYLKLGGLLVRRTCLWRDIRRFASWLESDGAQLAEEADQSTIVVEPNPDQSGAMVMIARAKHPDLLGDYQLLWDFLLSLDIKRVEFDSRLETNQVVDIVTLLYSYRRKLAKRQPGKIPASIAGHLLGPSGLHMSCACIRIKGETLAISYTYCTLAFSRLMRWFEQRHRNFHDYRALFHAAPRYALLVLVIAIAPSIVYTRTYGDWLQFTISAFAAFLLTGLVVGIYDCSTGELCYVNAGHHPQPWRMPTGNGEPMSSITGGRTLLMGVEEDIEIEPSRLTLGAGDIVLFASDGVVENQDAEGQIYGTDRFDKFLQTQRGGSVESLVESIVNEWRTYSEGAKQTDDRTVLALRIKDGRNRPDTADAQAHRSNSSA